MESLSSLMSVYQHHHTKSITKLTHFIGVPCIIFSLEILLSRPHLAIISLSWIAVMLLSYYYLLLNIRIGIVTSLFLVISNYFAVQVAAQDNHTALVIFAATFIFGWAAQFVGHYFEGKRPAFMANLFQLFVAPVFLAAECFFMLGYMDELRKTVCDTSNH